jgi:Protein of unknown function (DUF3996)
MKKRTWLWGLIIFLLPLSSASQQRDFGLGVIIGEPTGISWKAWTGGSTAFAGAAAWSFGDRDAFQLHVDYLFHNFRLFKVSKGRLPFYYGLGVRARFHEKRDEDGDTVVGVRFPLGLEYLFASPSVGIFAEIVPILDLAPATDFDLNGAIGFRIYF